MTKPSCYVSYSGLIGRVHRDIFKGSSLVRELDLNEDFVCCFNLDCDYKNMNEGIGYCKATISDIIHYDSTGLDNDYQNTQTKEKENQR